MTDRGAPLTNNLVGHALHKANVLQNISGCFETKQGESTFFTIRCDLATMHKQHANLLDGSLIPSKAGLRSSGWPNELGNCLFSMIELAFHSIDTDAKGY